jgi:predicted TIM-barrel fold metal-dependent hydrolase
MQIFDSIAHPTVKGEWFGKPADNTFESLVSEYKANDIAGGCAVSLPFIELEELESFYKRCRSQTEKVLYPVAAFNFTEKDYERKLLDIKSIGFRAIKIHTRLANISIDRDYEKLANVFELCEKHKLIIFYCTYYHGLISMIPEHPLSYYLIKLLKRAPSVKIVLLHGGDVNLMNLSQIARFNPNVLLDLSYTFIKFKGAALEQDIVYLMNNLDKKICFGSDYPEYSIDTFKKHLEHYASKVINSDKLDNVSCKNILRFLEII